MLPSGSRIDLQQEALFDFKFHVDDRPCESSQYLSTSKGRDVGLRGLVCSAGLTMHLDKPAEHTNSRAGTAAYILIQELKRRLHSYDAESWVVVEYVVYPPSTGSSQKLMFPSEGYLSRGEGYAAVFYVRDDAGPVAHTFIGLTPHKERAHTPSLVAMKPHRYFVYM